MEEAFNDRSAVQQQLVDAQVDELTEQLKNVDLLSDVVSAQEEKVESPHESSPAFNPFAEPSQVESSVIESNENSNVESSNLANEALTSTYLHTEESINVVEESVPAEMNAEPFVPEVISNESIDDSVPDIVQHASDSGYCFTNSISEFSASFPSDKKLEENLCSTPNNEEAQADLHSPSESGLIESQNTVNLVDADISQVSLFFQIVFFTLL